MLGQGMGHTPEQRVAASTLRRYSFGLRLAIAQADARPALPVVIDAESFRNTQSEHAMNFSPGIAYVMT